MCEERVVTGVLEGEPHRRVSVKSESLETGGFERSRSSSRRDLMKATSLGLIESLIALRDSALRALPMYSNRALMARDRRDPVIAGHLAACAAGRLAGLTARSEPVKPACRREGWVQRTDRSSL